MLGCPLPDIGFHTADVFAGGYVALSAVCWFIISRQLSMGVMPSGYFPSVSTVRMALTLGVWWALMLTWGLCLMVFGWVWSFIISMILVISMGALMLFMESLSGLAIAITAPKRLGLVMVWLGFQEWWGGWLMGDLNLILMCVAIVMCIFVSAFFSCSETVFMAANRYRISHLAKQSKAASRALRLLDEPEQLLGVVLVGNTVANILVSVLVTKVSFHLGADFGVMVATTLLVVFVLIFCEVIPKNVGVKYSESLALSLSGVLTLLKFMMMPVVRAVNACVKGLFWLVVAIVKVESRGVLTRDELHGVVKEETSGLSRSDQSMLLGVLSLDDLTVSDVMRPVSKLALLDIQLPWAEFLNQMLAQEVTQMVIYRHSLDQVLGLLDMREVLRLMHRGPLNKAGLLYVLKPVVYVPLTAALKDQWSLLLWGKNKLILVIDEYGDLSKRFID